MKKYFILLLFVFLSVNFVASQQKIKASGATISFVFVEKKVDGTISGFSSSSTIDSNDFSNSKLKGSVEVATLSTGNFLRDWSLKSSKYFDADTYPTMSFESISIKKVGDNYEVLGQLTIKKISKPLTFIFKQVENSLVGTTSLYSSDFDIQILKKSREANKVEIQVTLTLE